MAPPRKTNKTSAKFQPKQMVFAKMAGYPQWPAFITPQELIPKSVMKAKKKSADYCVMFIPDGDFYWVTDKSLELLTNDKLNKSLKDVPEEIKKQAKSLKGKKRGKSSNIKEALAAAEGLDFKTFIKAFNEDAEEEGDGEEEEDEEEESEVEENEEVGEESSEIEKVDDETGNDVAENEGDDEGEAEEVEIEEKTQRKKPNTSRNGKTKPISKKATPRNGRNLKRKLEEEQKEEEEEEDDEPEQPSKSNTEPITKQQTPPESKRIKSETSDEDSSSGKSKLTEEEKQHQLWICRIKLQRSLIQRNQPTTPKDTSGLKPPTADELSVARLILYRLGEFPVSKELLKKTKIHKVLKCILRDPELEYPDSFKLHERCDELLLKWDPIVQALKIEKSNTPQKVSEDDSKGSDKSATNGDYKKSHDDSEVSGIEHSIPEIEPKKEKPTVSSKSQISDRTPTSVES
ncbi:PWWP domain-containing protein [Spathaspora sp. JA1]|nr:PWWP domain-containing protein [Spathaspora sp. JA1]